jgi:3D (Asp-Asp-Asp) domain-containing protein
MLRVVLAIGLAALPVLGQGDIASTSNRGGGGRVQGVQVSQRSAGGAGRATIGDLFDLIDAQGRQQAPQPRIRIVRCLVTAYTPEKAGGGAGTGLTSRQQATEAFPWGVAADPRALPYGALVRIPGYQPTIRLGADAWWSVDDTGGRLRRDWVEGGVVHLDVRFIHRDAAMRWGRQWLDVEVMDP